jgi:pimeloyl-ACP methyl ester carboxylesterase
VEHAPAVYDYAYTMVQGKSPGQMAAVLAGTFTRTIEGARANPPGLVGSGYYALMRLGEFVPSRVVEAVVHGMDLTDALGQGPIATPEGVAMTAAIFDELLARRTVPGRIARPIVLGHSMGGPIVLLCGARHPGHAAGLIVSSGFARWDPPRMVEGFRRVAGDEVAEIARRSYAGEEVPDEQWARVFAAFGPQLPDDEREAHPPKNLELNSHGMGLVRQLDIVDQLSRIDTPTLVCAGELDPVTPVAAAEEIASALPEGIAQLTIIAGAGHFTCKDAPDRYWPMITGFITGTTGGELART